MSNMRINIFNPEWASSEKEMFFSLLNNKNIPSEEEFQEYVKVNKKLYFSSCGKSSLYAILKSNNIGKGDEVIIPWYCCEAAAYPIRYLHAKPVLADIDVSDLNISVDSVLKLISPKTKAIIVPSMYGNPANIIEIKEKIGKNALIINDMAQAYGCTLNNTPIECFGDAGFLSCGPGKQLTGAGGSLFWSNNNNICTLKNQNIPVNKIFHKLFYYTRVDIDKNIKSPFYKIALNFYRALNQHVFRVNKSATPLDINVMLMLMENYPSKLEGKRIFIADVEKLSENKTYRLIKNQRGTGSPLKIVLLFNSAKACNSAKRILDGGKIYYSTGYEKLKGVEKTVLRRCNQILGKIIEIPLEVRKKECILDVLKKID